MFGRAHVSRLKGDMLTSTSFQPLTRLVKDNRNNSVKRSLREFELLFMKFEMSQKRIQIDMGN